MTQPIRIVLAEDNYLVREGTRGILEETGDVEVLAAVQNADALIEAVETLHPDAVMTDIRMPPAHHMEGIRAAHAIRSRHPTIGVVVLSNHSDGAYALELFRADASGLGYLLKDRVAEPEQLVDALRAVAIGRSVIDPKVVEALVGARSAAASSPLADLTPREMDVLREMASGKTNTAIGKSLHLSNAAVEKHVTSLFSKLELSREFDVHRRVKAVLTFLETRR